MRSLSLSAAGASDHLGEALNRCHPIPGPRKVNSDIDDLIVRAADGNFLVAR